MLIVFFIIKMHLVHANILWVDKMDAIITYKWYLDHGL